MGVIGEDPHSAWMQRALEEAQAAADAGEVPVGAALVRDGELLATGHNAPISRHDPTAHAEINVLREAALRAGNYRLPGSTLYVTIEPCPMCVGALIHARVATVVFGAREPRAGALVSREPLSERHWLNHHPRIIEGVEAEAASSLMQAFFRRKRQ